MVEVTLVMLVMDNSGDSESFGDSAALGCSSLVDGEREGDNEYDNDEW